MFALLTVRPKSPPSRRSFVLYKVVAWGFGLVWCAGLIGVYWVLHLPLLARLFLLPLFVLTTPSMSDLRLTYEQYCASHGKHLVGQGHPEV